MNNSILAPTTNASGTMRIRVFWRGAREVIPKSEVGGSVALSFAFDRTVIGSNFLGERNNKEGGGRREPNSFGGVDARVRSMQVA